MQIRASQRDPAIRLAGSAFHAARTPRRDGEDEPRAVAAVQKDRVIAAKPDHGRLFDGKGRSYKGEDMASRGMAYTS